MDEELLQEVKKDIQKASAAAADFGGHEGGRFGPWRIEQLLGRNSIGELYLARAGADGAGRDGNNKVGDSKTGDIKDGKVAALRSFDSALSRNPRLVKRFLQEAEKAASVTNPAIAAVLAFGRTEDGSAYMVREYVDGHPLSEALKDGPVEFGRCVEIVTAVCRALEAAAKCELVHRNLNPSSVIIEKSGAVRVVDFGLSKSVPAEGRDTRGLTHYNERRDDNRYASPEQVKDDRLDVRSDIYSLGCLMHLLFSGEVIFADRDGFRLLQSKIQGQVKPQVFQNLRVGSAVKDRQKLIERVGQIVLRAVAGDRKWRYQSPSELTADLERASRGEDLHKDTQAAVREINLSAGLPEAVESGESKGNLIESLKSWPDKIKKLFR